MMCTLHMPTLMDEGSGFSPLPGTEYMEKTGGLRPLSEGKDAPKPVGIRYYGGVGTLGKLDAFKEGGIPKFMVRARVETKKEHAYSDGFILMPLKCLI